MTQQGQPLDDLRDVSVDALWLLLHRSHWLAPAPVQAAPADTVVDPADQRDPAAETGPDDIPATRPPDVPPPSPATPPKGEKKKEDDRGSDLYVQDANATPPEGKSESERAFRITIDSPLPLPGREELAEALRPLTRRARIGRATELDVEETIRRTEAAAGQLQAVLRPPRRRVAALDVVVDASRSMDLWRGLDTDLQQLFESLGAFRRVNLHYLSDDAERVRLLDHSRAPRGLAAERGARLVLVVSDTIGPAWRSGAALRWMQEQGEKSLVALVHLFPTELQARTALMRRAMGLAKASSPYAANRYLTWLNPSERLRRMLPPLPLVTLNKQGLADLARLATAAGRHRVSAIAMREQSPAALQAATAAATSSGPTAPESPAAAEERLRGFLRTASQTTRKLLDVLAAIPLMPEIMRLAQRRFAPESRHWHLAEIVFGGLMRRVPEPQDDPSACWYEFYTPIRELLVKRGSVPQQLDVVESIGDYLLQRYGFDGRFGALMPDAEGSLSIPSYMQRSFARARALVHRGLGGRIARRAEAVLRELDAIENGQENSGTAGNKEVSKPADDVLQPVGSVRVVLVGEIGVGKSNIWRLLRTQTWDSPDDENSGIAIGSFSLPCARADVSIRLWDFSSTAMRQSVHRLFLSEQCVYVLALSPKSAEELRDAEYWLELLRRYAGQSPVLVALNRINVRQRTYDVDREALKQRYPNIRGFTPTHISSPAGCDELKALLAETISSLGEDTPPHRRIPPAWHRVIQDCSMRRRQPHLRLDEFAEICVNHDVTDMQSQDSLSRLMHELGVIYHFVDDAQLREIVILDPSWLASSMGRIASFARTDATMLFSDVLQALPGEGEAIARFLMQLMERDGICYPITQPPSLSGRWLFPKMLEQQEPASVAAEGWDGPGRAILSYVYESSEQVDAVGARFMAMTDHLCSDRLRWRHGVVLRENGARALVRRERTEPQGFEVIVCGPETARNSLLATIQRTLESIHSKLPGTTPHIERETGQPGAPFPESDLDSDETLQETADASTQFVTEDGTPLVTENGEPLEAIAERDTKPAPLHIFLGAEHRDDSLANIFIQNLTSMEREGSITFWHDGLSAPSISFTEIEQQLMQADIFVGLLTINLLSPSSFSSFEAAKKRYESRSPDSRFTVVLIQVDPVGRYDVDPHKYYILTPGGKTLREYPTLREGFDVAQRELEEVIRAIQRGEEVPSIPSSEPPAPSVPPQEPENKPLRAVLGYSSKDSSLASAFEPELKELMASNLITPWQDAQTDFGHQWPEEIEPKLREMDVYIGLLTSTYVELHLSEQIHFGAGRKKRRGEGFNKEVLYVLILVSNVSLKGIDLSGAQLLKPGGKAVNQHSSMSEGFRVAREELEVLIHRFQLNREADTTLPQLTSASTEAEGVILALDIVNSTSALLMYGLAGDSGADVVNQVFSTLEQTIRRASGSVVSFTGDGMVAFFDQRHFSKLSDMADPLLGICADLYGEMHQALQSTRSGSMEAYSDVGLRVALHYGKVFLPTHGPLQGQALGRDVIITCRLLDDVRHLMDGHKGKHPDEPLSTGLVATGTLLSKLSLPIAGHWDQLPAIPHSGLTEESFGALTSGVFSWRQTTHVASPKRPAGSDPKAMQGFIAYDSSLLDTVFANLLEDTQDYENKDELEIHFPTDRTKPQGVIWHDYVRPRIDLSHKVLAFMDLPNANVGFEVGYALGMDKEVALVKSSDVIHPWHEKPPLKLHFIHPLETGPAIRDYFRTKDFIKLRTLPNKGRIVRLLCPDPIGGYFYRQVPPSWRRVGGVSTTWDLGSITEHFDGVGLVVWIILPPSAGGTGRDGMANATFAILAGYALARPELNLRIFAHESSPNIADALKFTETFGTNVELRQKLADLEKQWSSGVLVEKRGLP